MTSKENSVFTQLVPYITALEKIRIYYKGLMDTTGEWRDVEPYLIGINKKGNLVLSAYFEPSDTSEGKAGWKTYLLSSIQRIDATGEYFADDRLEFNRHDSRMQTIIYCIP